MSDRARQTVFRIASLRAAAAITGNVRELIATIRGLDFYRGHRSTQALAAV